MKKPCFIGIDTSNYTTSLSVVDIEGCVIDNLKIPLFVKEGERGLRQSDAVFLHTKNLPELFLKAKDRFTEYSPVCVGVSTAPRNREGSYMPCFLAGKASAYAVASTMEIPVYEFSHQNGHIMAAAYSSEMPQELLEKPFLAFHVSGGTTEAILVRPVGDVFDCEIIGGTKDINAGQAIDRVGVYMGLKFPCGAELDGLALQYSGKRKTPKISVMDGYCNLSGLENKAVELYKTNNDKEETAAFVFDFVGATLEAITKDILTRYNGYPVLYGGGVMSSAVLQKRLKKDNTYFAKPQFSADNAAGIALLARRRHLFK